VTANLASGTLGMNALGLLFGQQGSIRLRRDPTRHAAAARRRSAKG
jgi:hypothetical protein